MLEPNSLIRDKVLVGRDCHEIAKKLLTTTNILSSKIKDLNVFFSPFLDTQGEGGGRSGER